VGADTPQEPLSSYQAAFALLDDVDVVLGPAVDGGYHLVGATAPLPRLFVGVPMGTEVVPRVTLRRATRAGLSVGLLPPLRDLDRAGDLQAALAGGELAASPHTRAVVTEWLRPVGSGEVLAGVLAAASEPAHQPPAQRVRRPQEHDQPQQRDDSHGQHQPAQHQLMHPPALQAPGPPATRSGYAARRWPRSIG
jgi:hypothetical protein